MNKRVPQKMTMHFPREGLVLSDRRLYHYLLHDTLAQLPQKLNFSISWDALSGVYSDGVPEAGELKRSMRRLVSAQVEIVKKQHFSLCTLLASVHVDEKKRIVEFRFSKAMRQILLNPETLEQCLLQAHFTYKYTQALYQILAHDIYQGSQKCRVIDIEQLRYEFGMPQDKMRNFTDFNRFVLTPALDEINTYASFSVTVLPIKQGRKVVQLQFDLSPTAFASGEGDLSAIVPPKRPVLHGLSERERQAYRFIMSAKTDVRKQYFMKAMAVAKQQGAKLAIAALDTPDLWYQWVLDMLLEECQC